MKTRLSKYFSLLLHFREMFRTSSLFRNSIYLMGSTIIMSVMGFGFWVFVAHLYTPADIGNAAALISLSALITNLSLLGINASLIRFLAKAKDQSRMINAAIILVGSATAIASLGYLIIGSHFSATARLFTSSPLHMILFALIMATISINSLTDAVFIARRRAEFHTIAYGLLGGVRLIAPLFLITFGSWGIFTSYIIATFVSLIASFFFMHKACDYRLFSRPDWSIIAIVKKYAINNYIAVLVAGIPSQVMPLLIVQNLGADKAAFYSMAWTMANLLYIIPSATTQSLLAETSNDDDESSMHVRSTIKMLVYLLLPVIALSILVAPFLLEIFGQEYSNGSTLLFQVFAFGTIFMAINSIGSTVLNIQKRTFGIIIAQFVALVVTLTSVGFLWNRGLLGVGIASLSGMIASNAVYGVMLLRSRRHKATALPTSQLTRSIVSRMLKAYGITQFEAESLPNGSKNHTILVVNNDTKYVLRIYEQNSKNISQIKEEIAFMSVLGANGVPVPTVLPNKTGTMLSSMKVAGSSFHFIIMSFEAGFHPDDYSSTLVRHMAKVQSRIHQVGRTYKGAANGATVAANRRPLSNVLPTGYSHFDFDASNILVNKGRSIISVLDFEGMRYGPLWICLYFSLRQIYAQSEQLTFLKQYVNEYQKIRPLTRLERLATTAALTVRFKKPSFISLYKAA